MTHESIRNLDTDTIDTLKDLARVNIASAKGFLTAADNVGDPRLMDLFLSTAADRREFAEQIGVMLAMNLEEPPAHGTAGAMLHRWWIDLRSRFSEDPYGVLAEAERAEDQIKEAYEDALEKTLGSPIHGMLVGHCTRIRQVHDHIRDLRDQAEARRKVG